MLDVWIHDPSTGYSSCRVVTSLTTFRLRAAGFLAAAGFFGTAASAVPSPEPLWNGDGRMRCTLP